MVCAQQQLPSAARREGGKGGERAYKSRTGSLLSLELDGADPAGRTVEGKLAKGGCVALGRKRNGGNPVTG